MILLGLRTVIYKVQDLEKAKDWYHDVFGITPYFNEPFYVGYNIGGYELGLDPDLSDGNIIGQNTLTYWGVDHLHTVMELLKNKNITIVQDVQNVGGDILVATIADPFGNLIGLIENPEFKLPG